MAVVKIESRREYELHVKSVVAKGKLKDKPNKIKAIAREIAMQCFDDGIAMNMGKLYVETLGE